MNSSNPAGVAKYKRKQILKKRVAKVRQWLAAAALILALLSPAYARPVTPDKVVSYGPYPIEQGGVFLPRFKPKLVTICIPGGGWTAGNMTDGYFACDYFRDRGAVGLSIGYTLFRKADPSTYAPRAVSDVQMAVRYARSQWPGLKVVLFGASAGGHLALMAGSNPKTLRLDTARDPLAQGATMPDLSSQPDAVISVSGPTDIPAWVASGIPANLAANLPVMVQGASQAKTAAANLWAWSPLVWATPDGPPVMLIHGAADAVVPFGQAVEMQDKLNQMGVPNVLVQHPGGHLFGGLTGKQRRDYLGRAYEWALGAGK